MKIPTLALICLAATALGADEAPVTSQSFVARASMASMFEVEAGKLAQARGGSAPVKSYAQRMVTDHGASNSELEKIVASSYAVPKQLDAEHQVKLDALKGLQGQEFDSTYGKDMMQGHEQAIELFTKAATSAQVSPSLQAFARKTLPTLQEHGKLALGLPGAHTH
jgi:putative membrane protein